MKRILVVAAAASVFACGSDKAVDPPGAEGSLALIGHGPVSERHTAEINVRGNYAYTSTWGFLQVYGNAVKVWNVAGNTPQLVDSLIVDFASTLGDVQVTDDGQLLVVATELTGGAVMIFSLADPAHPQPVTRYTTPLTHPGGHTAEVQPVNGEPYAFLCIDPGSSSPARLVIVDLSTPSAPQQVFSAAMGSPYVHDVYVRDGILITALWNQGITIWDIGGGARGGSVSNPVQLGNVVTVGGKAHNVWWYHSASGEKRYAFVGEEGPGSIGSSAIGDIHVVDVSNMASPREVAFYHLAGAGTHNFYVDEARGILYAAYYNGGVRAIDVSGDLSTCDASARSPNGRCDLGKMGRELASGPTGVGAVYIWGVQLSGGNIYASDMLNGIWKLAPVP